MRYFRASSRSRRPYRRASPFRRFVRGRRREFPNNRLMTGLTAATAHLKSGSRSVASIPHGLGFLPETLNTSLIYTDSGRITSVLTESIQAFRMNSLFDPDLTNVGHQPNGFDQLMGIYQYFMVNRVDVELTVRQRTAHGISVVMVPDVVGGTSVSYDNTNENPRLVGPVITASNQPAAMLTATWKPHEILGITYQDYSGDAIYKGTGAASPSSMAYWRFVVNSMDDTTAIDFEYSVKITFRCSFSGRTIPTRS